MCTYNASERKKARTTVQGDEACLSRLSRMRNRPSGISTTYSAQTPPVTPPNDQQRSDGVQNQMEEKTDMQGEQGIAKFLGEEGIFGNETPVDCPFVQELTGQVVC